MDDAGSENRSIKNSLRKVIGSTTKRKSNNKKIVLNPYQKIHSMRQRRYRLFSIIMALLIALNLLEIGWAIAIVSVRNSTNFKMPGAIALIVVIHLSVILIYKCIISRGQSIKARQLVVNWLCCLRVSDPYDVEVHVSKTRARNRRLRLEMKKKEEEEFHK